MISLSGSTFLTCTAAMPQGNSALTQSAVRCTPPLPLSEEWSRAGQVSPAMALRGVKMPKECADSFFPKRPQTKLLYLP